MSKHLKRFFGVFLAVCMAISPVYVFADRASVINISTLTIDNTGLATIIGNVTNAGANTQMTCLAMTSENLETTDKIFGVDQVTVGNNGTFLVKFRIPYRFANQKGYFRFGTDADADAVLKTYQIGDLPPNVHNISNGSVIYGADAYTPDSVYLTGTYVADSIVNGGNRIYYKFGDKYYDLLDENATSNAYLVAENAMASAEVNKIKLRYYYQTARRVDCGV